MVEKYFVGFKSLNGVVNWTKLANLMIWDRVREIEGVLQTYQG